MATTPSPPSPDGLPILGNALQFSRDPVGSMAEWAALGDVVRIEVPGQRIHLVTHPDPIERVLVDDHDRFTIGPAQQETFEGVEDDAVTVATGKRWSRLRRALGPAFASDRLAVAGDRTAETTADFIQGLPEGETVSLHRACRRLTVRIVGAALLEADLAGREDVVMEASDALVDRTSLQRPGQLLPDWVPTPTDRRFRRTVGRLDDLVDEIVAERSAAEAGENAVGDLLAARDRGDLSDGEVRDNLVGFLLAGHESPAAALTHAWWLAAEHPSVFADLREEYRRVVDGDRPSGAEYDDLEIHRNVVAEALRLYPPTLGINRVATQPLTLGDYRFDAGAEFVLPQWPVHRDERWWDEPETFDPDRWCEPGDRPEFAYFPFGGGPRICVGGEFARRTLPIALATMVGELEPHVDVERPVSFSPSVALRPTSRIDATIRRRG